MALHFGAKQMFSYDPEKSSIDLAEKYINFCEGSFCNNATWRAEGDHDVDFDIEKRGSRTQNSTEGLRFGPRASGTLLKNI